MEPAAHPVRARRTLRGLSQGELAQRAGVSRQSINAIEAGRATPGVDVAVRIAAALDATVEALFSAADPTRVPAVSAEPLRAGERVALAHVDGRFVAHALRGDSARVAADGAVRTPSRTATRPNDVTLFSSVADARENVVLMGCAPGLGPLADRLNARAGPGRFLWIAASSATSLAALGDRHAHVCGLHVVDDEGREGNVAAARAAVGAGPVAVVTFARWQEGLLLREGDRARIRGVGDLARKGVRLVAREQGAGAQRLLERSLRAAGLPARLAQDAPVRAAGHLDVARAIAQGGADAGVATADAARAFGLRFLPLADERYDLVVSAALLADPRIARMLDMLTSQPFRRDLDALGYDVTHAGDTVAEVRR